jgi:phage gpG-like protein
LVKWKKRKRGSKRNIGRAVLTNTGRLRRSLTKKKTGNYTVLISTNVDYAQVHNEGLRSGRGKGFKMPKRQFVGYSQRLRDNLKQKFDLRIKKLFS